MLLKKAYREEIFQIAIILSLFRDNYNRYEEQGNYFNSLVESGRTLIHNGQIDIIESYYDHTKAHNYTIYNFGRNYCNHLNTLGQYIYCSNYNYYIPNMITLFLNVDESSNEHAGHTTIDNNPVEDTTDEEENRQNDIAYIETAPTDIELTQEDMDLIDILWKNDVDLGIVLDMPLLKNEAQKKDLDHLLASESMLSLNTKECRNITEESNAKNGNFNINDHKDDSLSVEITDNDIKREFSNDLTHSDNVMLNNIDTETGELFIKTDAVHTFSSDIETNDGISFCDDLNLENEFKLPILNDDFLLDEALQLASELDDINLSQNIQNKTTFENKTSDASNKIVDSVCENNNIKKISSDPEGPSSTALSVSHNIQQKNIVEDLLLNMIQTPPHQFHHPVPSHRAFQSHMPFVRAVSMEQRWQDLANLLSLPPAHTEANTISHHHHHHHPFTHHHPGLRNYSHHHHSISYSQESTRGVLLHNATLAPPVDDMNTSTTTYGGSGANLGTAVAASMNITSNNDGFCESNSTAIPSHYKLEPFHDMMYIQNTYNEMNQSDGFLSSILNDEDLQLVDMAVNEGMYSMRMLDNNNTNTNINNSSSSNNINSGSNLTLSGTAASAGSTSITSSMPQTDVERVDTSSDSAVSSMGSERVPSLSDGEWCDAGSDSGHTAVDPFNLDSTGKYRLYDYSFPSRSLHLPNLTDSVTNSCRTSTVAQKKHQMFGKRCFQEHSTSNLTTSSLPKYQFNRAPISTFNNSSNSNSNNNSNVEFQTINATSHNVKLPESKYSCSIEFNRISNQHLQQPLHHHPQYSTPLRTPLEHIHHNHTYHLPRENTFTNAQHQKSTASISSTFFNGNNSTNSNTCQKIKDKGKKRIGSEEEHLTRDEKRARALNIPMTVNDIINLPMDEFNERLSKYDLSEVQLSLIRDIRRRGKNKVAAQNCRKRKLDQILSLADEVKDMKDRKTRLMSEHDFMSNECQRIKEKYQRLYRHIFQNIRDSDGNHYSPYQYCLQPSPNGSLILMPRNNTTANKSEILEDLTQLHK